MATKQLAPFAPTASQPFDRCWAAHLLRRTGFGAAPAEIDKAVERGLDDTIEELFDEAADQEAEFAKLFQAVNSKLLNFSDAGQCQAWWIFRMLSTHAPLREKLTLFWHGHFATSFQKVGDMRLMHRQVEMLRRLAWGSFRDLVVSVAKDPAMLVYLDGESNTKEHPNENFARELMELFTCGIGNYTEADVLAAARAFSGWHRNDLEFAFNAEAHDFGPKKFLGKSGRFDGTDIIDILMSQPATSRFIAAKLLRFFASPDPAPDVIDEAAELLDRTQLNIKWFLRDLFQSQYFFSEACHRRRIASPVEFVIGTARTLGVNQPALELVGHLQAMNQELFAPPNVKGWDGERKWINSTTLAARQAFGRQVADLQGDGDFGPRLAIEQLVPPGMNDARAVVDSLNAALFQGELPAETRKLLVELALVTDAGPNPDQFRDDEDFRVAKTRNLVATMLSLPEYQAY